MTSRNGRSLYMFDHDSDNDSDGNLADLADLIEDLTERTARYGQPNDQRWLRSIAERSLVLPFSRGSISLQSARDYYYSRERDLNLDETLPRYEQRNYTIPTATLPPAYAPPESGSSSLAAPPAQGSASRSPSPTGGPRTSRWPKATFPNGPLIRLSLDAGGGNRTTKQLGMLVMLMRKISGNLGRNCSVHANILKPCDVFHLIVGSGTGGLVAILLGRLRMSVREVKEFYEGIEKDVFGPWVDLRDVTTKDRLGLGDILSRTGGPSSVRSKTTVQLEEKVGRLVQIRDMGTAFQESEVPLGKVLVSAVREMGPDRLTTVLLCSNPSLPSDIKPSIVEAVRATMAHMPFFKPATITDVPGTFHGSPTRFSNPVDILDQAPDSRIGGFALRPPPILPRVHVSIGAVVPDDDEVQSARGVARVQQEVSQLPDKMTFDGVMDWNARVCAKIEDTARDVTGGRNQRNEEPNPLRYFRLNHSTQHMRGLEDAADMAARVIGDIRRGCIRRERDLAATVQRPIGAPGVR